MAVFWGCSAQEDVEIETHTVEDQVAEEYSNEILGELAPSTAGGLNLSLWASEKLLGDPVALDVDHDGTVWVTNTARRRTSEIDIRGHRNWMIESLTLETVEERRDFLHRKLAPERSAQNEWLNDHNGDGSHDWRDLTVNKESVFRVRDLTGNGYANQSQLFVRDFHEEITDVAGAVLRHEGDLFLGVAPDLWRIQDSDGDGYGEQKESISHGYGVNIGYGGHGMSGLTVGPAGRLYWSIGDRGISIEDQEGNRWHQPRQGVIVRSDPDGSNFEVYARGLRNTHEFDFDKHGNLIAVDNDGDHSGEHERLIYVVNGSDSGWRTNWQFGKYNDPKNNDYKVLMDEGYYKPRFDKQAAHLLPPIAAYHDGPAGMVYNPGTALDEQWQDHFFVAEFVGSTTRSGINAFTLEQQGASFQLERDVEVMKGVLAVGLDFSPGGALYFTDWVEGWALNQEGRIWKLDTNPDSVSNIRIETKELLAEEFGDRSPEELIGLMGHADMRVRQKAQFELVGRDDTLSLEKAARGGDHQLKRVHGIWGLAQVGRRIPEAVEPLMELLADEEAEIRAQAAKMLGDVRYQPAGDSLIPLLRDENARVRFFAAEALGRLAWKSALQPIVDMLEANDDKDVYLRHGGAIALARIGDGDAVAALSDHPSRAVRIAAVVALKRMEHPGVVRFLEDEDEFVVTNAARAINDDAFIEEGLDELAAMLEQDQFINEPLLRRSINANLYHGTRESARRLADFALREDIPEALRVEALQTLSVWPESSRLDRVTGDPRDVVRNNVEEARSVTASSIRNIMNGNHVALKIAAFDVVGSLEISSLVPKVSTMLAEDPAPQVRIAALELLAGMGYEDIEEAVFTALDDPAGSVRMNALQTITELNLPKGNIVELVEPVIDDGTTEEQQTAIALLGEISSPGANALLEKLLQQLMNGDLERELELEVIQAADSSNAENVEKLLATYRSEKENGDAVTRYRETLYGGDAENGRDILYQHEAAQCMRCHKIGTEGSEVGPPLTNIGNELSRRTLLEALVAPDARIAPGYGSVSLTLRNGETIQGVLQEEDEEEITVVSRENEWVISKSEISERTNSPSSMPTMSGVLSRAELRDLVEFLTTLDGENR
ncbi:HEAT repeat domain-containing protein [Halalkalibaculum sp. DA3122]|uniref:HEAT repeat domain-containing protein n=1 Tax=Halalkalibaculum sp. DA3122 TaxID=3373607 RepID=UPI003754A754